MDVHEDAQNINTVTATFELPGLAKENVSIDVHQNTLTVSGESKVEELTLRDTVTQEASALPVTGLFVAIGADPRTGLFADQLAIDPDGTVQVDGRSSRTSLPRVFAAGDVLDPTYKQAITAAGSGCAAAIDAGHYLDARAG